MPGTNRPPNDGQTETLNPKGNAFTTEEVTMTDSKDPFDPRNFAAASSITGEVGVEKIMTNIPIRKPKKFDWFRAHGGSEFSLRARTIEDKDNSTTYLVHDSAAQSCPEMTTLRDLTLCVDRAGNLFYWAVPVVEPGARENQWHSSARRAMAEAVEQWVRIAANTKAGQYDIAVNPNVKAEPVWPTKTRSELLALAFPMANVITDPNHQFLRLLRGDE